MFFTSAGNPKNIGRAKKIFSSVFWGFCIVLSGWLLVQVVLQAITNKSFFTGNNWSSCQQYNGENTRPRNKSIGSVLSPIMVSNTPSGVQITNDGRGTVTSTNVDQNAISNATSNVALSAACVNNGVDCTLMQAVCVAESGCSTQVTGCNGVGACGPMQIEPATACQANPDLSGCVKDSKGNGVIGNLNQVQTALGDMQQSANTAAQILSAASAACNGDLTCTVAYYNGGQGAVQPSACCASGAAYQCQWDCGTTVAHSAQCDVTQSSQCVQNTGYAETRNYVTKIQAAEGALKAKPAGGNI